MIVANSANGRSSGRRTRRSVDDIEIGLPAAARDVDDPRERVGGKRRSITFTSYLSSLALPSMSSLTPSSAAAVEGESSSPQSKEEGKSELKPKTNE